jgi:acetyl-CoA carboxylase biotin carboxyl carrier protein
VKIKDIDIKQLFELMREHDVAEISLKDGKTSVEIKRNKEKEIAANPGLMAAVPFQAETAAAGIYLNHAAPTVEKMVDFSTPQPETIEENYHAVTAPLVGTFYRSPSPDASPFVEVGDTVNNGDVLCIVEAMKSMNEIQSDADGVVKEICVNNAELVEFDQVLFKIDKSG